MSPIIKDFKIYTKSNHWFIFSEFSISTSKNSKENNSEILEKLIGTKLLSSEVYHEEIRSKTKATNFADTLRPYHFHKISINDFIFLENLQDFKNWFFSLKNFDWGDFEDSSMSSIEIKNSATSLIEYVEEFICSKTDLSNGIWLLSKDRFKNSSDKLIHYHWIFIYFYTFIEINNKNDCVRTYDFGYD